MFSVWREWHSFHRIKAMVINILVQVRGSWLGCCFSVSVMSNSLPPHGLQMPGFLVLHCLLEFIQTHVHWVNDASQPSHPLQPTSPLALNLSQHQGLFQRIGSSHQVAKVFGASASASVLPMNILGCLPLGFTGLISLLSKGLSRIFSSTTVQKHRFFGAWPSLWSNSHISTWLLEKP